MSPHQPFSHHSCLPLPSPSRVHDPVIQTVLQRVATWVKAPVENHEDLQVGSRCRYRYGNAGCVRGPSEHLQGKGTHCSTGVYVPYGRGAPGLRSRCWRPTQAGMGPWREGEGEGAAPRLVLCYATTAWHQDTGMREAGIVDSGMQESRKPDQDV